MSQGGVGAEPTGARVALIRGINVGRARRLAMADLRRLMEEEGLRNVRTLIASGNAVFDAGRTTAPTAARRIEAALVRHGVPARAVVLTAAELATVIAENPLPGADQPSRLFVAVFLPGADRAALAPLLRRDWGPERIAVGSRAAYFWCPLGSAASDLVPAVTRVVGDQITVRNWATITRLHQMATAEGSSNGPPRSRPVRARHP